MHTIVQHLLKIDGCEFSVKNYIIYHHRYKEAEGQEMKESESVNEKSSYAITVSDVLLALNNEISENNSQIEAYQTDNNIPLFLNLFVIILMMIVFRLTASIMLIIAMYTSIFSLPLSEFEKMISDISYYINFFDAVIILVYLTAMFILVDEFLRSRKTQKKVIPYRNDLKELRTKIMSKELTDMNEILTEYLKLITR